jgi:RNA polymerase sigma factor (sigma-70 family)
MQQEKEFLQHLFQSEFAKMVAVISRQFGLQYIETAEDIVSDTFLAAAENWGMKGLPPNPTAWLYSVAKQKTLYHFKRSKIYTEKILPALKNNTEAVDENAEVNFSAENIKDSQLQMLFAVCTPAIASEAQIGLALRILCGFGIDEIAEAFLSNKETINKRLFRAKEKLREEKIKMEFPSEHEIINRLDNVLRVIYLLFNEGYYSKTQNQILQKDLCFEAMQLGIMLTEYEITNQPKTNALVALMCFHASRFDARMTAENNLILYEQQDEKLWDMELVAQGTYFLEHSLQGDEISSWHLEARIAWWHCTKEDSKKKWGDILQLYNQLLKINYSPSAALNRIFALYKAEGIKPALAEVEVVKFETNHFYFLLLGELYKTSDTSKAKLNLQKARALAKTQTEKASIQKKIDFFS